MRKVGWFTGVFFIVLSAFGYAQAGVLADVYKGRIETTVFQTSVYGLPITVGPQSVEVDRCVDGIRIWYTRGGDISDDMKHPSIVALKAAVEKYYTKKFNLSVGSANCPEDPVVNRVKFTTAKVGDLAFYNAVERALNELGIGKVQVAAATPTSEPSWVNEVRGGKSGNTPQEICQQVELLSARVSMRDLRAVVAAAKSILSTYKLPVWMREKSAPCFPGTDRMVYLTESVSLMKIVVSALSEVGLKPQDIGTTPAGLRQKLLDDLKAQISEIRKTYKEGKGSLSDYYHPRLAETAGEGIKNWGFTAKQLGLTKDEIEILKE